MKGWSVIKYRCASCGAKLETGDTLSGKQEACPACRKVNPVPLSNQDLVEEKKRRNEKLRQGQVETLAKGHTAQEQRQKQRDVQEGGRTFWNKPLFGTKRRVPKKPTPKEARGLIRFKCYFCGAILESPESQVGKFQACPECKNTNEVPIKKWGAGAMKRAGATWTETVLFSWGVIDLVLCPVFLIVALASVAPSKHDPYVWFVPAVTAGSLLVSSILFFAASHVLRYLRTIKAACEKDTQYLRTMAAAFEKWRQEPAHKADQTNKEAQ